MRMAALLVTALLLMGCKQSHAADGYAFASKQYDRGAVLINKREYRSFADLRAALPARKSREWKDTRVARGAWGELHSDGSCTIHFIDPSRSYQPEWIGHETAHCFYGDWHPSARTKADRRATPLFKQGDTP